MFPLARTASAGAFFLLALRLGRLDLGVCLWQLAAGLEAELRARLSSRRRPLRG